MQILQMSRNVRNLRMVIAICATVAITQLLIQWQMTHLGST